MSDDPKPPAPEAGDDKRPLVMALVQWMQSVGDPYTYDEADALRAEVEAGRVVLSDTERRTFALAGLVLDNAATDHARRMFERAIAGSIARAMAFPDGIPGDEDNGGGKPS